MTANKELKLLAANCSHVESKTCQFSEGILVPNHEISASSHKTARLGVQSGRQIFQNIRHCIQPGMFISLEENCALHLISR